MNLRELARNHNQQILENESAGFGWPVLVTDPAGFTAAMVGMSGDIELSIDPDTGQAVTGRVAHVSLSLGALTDAGLGIPRAIAGGESLPWVVSFSDTEGVSYTFRVARSFPDRTLGMVLCNLEAYTP